MFVAKFRGAGQGAKALIAEIIVGSFATALRLPTPSLALIQIGESFGRTEPDPEIQDILRGSVGTNVGARYLEGAYNFDPVTIIDVVPNVAANIVWLDAFATNIDRTPRNPNMMFWNNGLWLIDHGAALYFHHHWEGVTEATSQSPFAPIRDHVLLPFAGSIAEADERLRPLLPPERIAE
ncbi:MAG: aminotransferase class I and II, partial [Chlorobi bacterium CHB2]|nr:aminotransferase class I and II [Chlorobi bacterium CHB2]